MNRVLQVKPAILAQKIYSVRMSRNNLDGKVKWLHITQVSVQLVFLDSYFTLSYQAAVSVVKSICRIQKSSQEIIHYFRPARRQQHSSRFQR